MGILGRIRKKNAKPVVEVDLGVSVNSLKGNFEVVEEYPVHNPHASVKIVKSPELGEGYHYFVDEKALDLMEYEAFNKIKGIISKELEPPEEEVNPKEYLLEQAKKIAEKYRRTFKKYTEESWSKIFYYIVRDLAGFGPLHVIMLDPNIEDISCNGLNTPIYIWHRKYESIPTNISFTNEQTVNDFLVKLAHRSSKHISSAKPVLDAMLPEKHRLAATFMKEVSTKGSTFCIRKFRADPFSIVDLINMGTLNERIAAYFWLLLEYKMSFMVIGGTGAGKTCMLNALLSLFSQNDKLVTVEEVPELSPPLPNWTQFHSRQSFLFNPGAASSISLFDLVKVSLRYRPDYIIVGEVRGEEAYVLFQALATGHGGLCTMHADSLENVVKRLTSPPMNVSEVYIPLMHSALHIERVELPSRREGISFGRRVRTVWEIEKFGKYHNVAYWDPKTDAFKTQFSDSVLLSRIALKRGVKRKDVLIELEMRETFLRRLVKNKIHEQTAVAEKMLFYNTKRKEAKSKKIQESAYEEEDEKEPSPRKTKRARKPKGKRLKEKPQEEKPIDIDSLLDMPITELDKYDLDMQGVEEGKGL